MPTEKRSIYAIGVALIVVSAVTFSTAGIFTKSVAAGSWEIIFWRGLFAAAFTVAWTVRQHEFKRNFFKIGLPGWAVAVVGASGSAAFIPAFKFTSIANVSLIYATAPLIAAAMAWLLIGERATRAFIIGCGLALLGVLVIVWGSLGQSNVIGDMLALWMTVIMAAVMVIYRAFPKTPGAGPMALQSVVLLPISLAFGRPFEIPFSEIVILAAFGLVFALASVTLAEGAKRVPSGQTALISSLETPLAPLLAFLIFVEIPTVATFFGGAMILAAVLFSIRGPEHAKKNPG